MKFAHSLGFPHYAPMLTTMTCSQIVELYTFWRVEADEREEGQAEAEERRLMAHMEKLSSNFEGGNGQ